MKLAALKAERIAALQASIEYFSNRNKSARELWVVREPIRNLRTRASAAEYVSVPSGNDPPDVRLRSAAFEVKETSPSPGYGVQGVAQVV